MRLNVSAATGGWTASASGAQPGRSAWCRSKCRIPASAFRPRSSASSSKRSSRPMPARAASTAARVWAWRSAVSWRACSAERSSCAARRAWAARSRCICRMRYVGPTVRSLVPTDRRGRCLADAASRWSEPPSARVEVVLDDRDDLQPGRPHAADRRGRPALRADPGRPGARQGAEGARRYARCRRAGACAPIPSDGCLARRVPPRHAGMDGAQSAQTGPRDTPHPRPDRHAWTRIGSTGWPAARLRSSPSRRRRKAWRPLSHESRTMRRRDASACSSSRTTRRSR